MCIEDAIQVVQVYSGVQANSSKLDRDIFVLTD